MESMPWDVSGKSFKSWDEQGGVGRHTVSNRVIW